MLRNVVKKKGHWIILRLLNENGANAIGAEVTATVAGSPRRAILYPSYGYCSSNDPRVHLGLGAAKCRRGRGAVAGRHKGAIRPVGAGRTHQLREGAAGIISADREGPGTHGISERKDD
ncbi:MAG: ASPIC/UnbV domain-containing protein [Planctomycetes bacterium]|nr:ASPIC/UnbV domain-containing protein [Planctomycetota bacterium]